MDIKQLVTGDPKTGFYPVTQDTITVIELNKAVMNLTNESSSEDIIAAFDNLESFQALIAEVRNPQNICSGILVNETPEDKRVGKYEASIIANTDAETLHVRWIENDKIVALTITNTDGTMSCIRTENNVGGTVDLSNYLAKNNTTPFTPNADYQPATKKYVDKLITPLLVFQGDYTNGYELTEDSKPIYDSISNNTIGNIIVFGGLFFQASGFYTKYGTFTVFVNSLNGINPLELIKNIVIPPYASYSVKLTIASDYKITINNITINPNQCILTESEYAALGTTPNTDNVLYFVTPDA